MKWMLEKYFKRSSSFGLSCFGKALGVCADKKRVYIKYKEVATFTFTIAEREQEVVASGEKNVKAFLGYEKSLFRGGRSQEMHNSICPRHPNCKKHTIEGEEIRYMGDGEI